MKRVGIGVAGLLVLLAPGAASSWPTVPTAPKPRVSVAPRSALIDSPVRVLVRGLAGGERVTLEATARDRFGHRWRSRLAVKASRSGAIDTHSDMSFFWSMRPSTGSGLFFPPLGRTPVRIRVLRGGQDLTSTVLEWRAAAPGVTATKTTLAGEGFIGTYFAAQPHSGPAVLQLGGAYGGHRDQPASLLASHGYPTLSLGYFGESGLPKTLEDIPLEYFAKALRWLALQPGVDPSRVVIAGVSRGGEAALLLAAIYPDLVHGVIASTPSASVLGAYPGTGNAWTLNGKPVPQGPIPVERIGAPTLAFGGGKDAVWPSAGEVRAILERDHEHGRRNIVGVIYPKAGHGVGLTAPNLPDGPWLTAHGTRFLSVGGTLAANERARAAGWKASLRFLGTLPEN